MTNSLGIPGLVLAAAVLVLGCGRSYQTIKTRAVSPETTTNPEPVSHPDSPQVDSLQKLGERQFHSGKLDVASQTFYKVIVQSPDNWKARYYLGLIATENGEFAVAESWFDQTLIQTSYDVTTRSFIYTSRARMYELAGDPARALLDYRTATNLDPQNVQAADALSRLNASIGSASNPK